MFGKCVTRTSWPDMRAARLPSNARCPRTRMRFAYFPSGWHKAKGSTRRSWAIPPFDVSQFSLSDETRARRDPLLRAFLGQELFFARKPPAITGEAAVFPNYAMAGHHNRNGIAGAGACH